MHLIMAQCSPQLAYSDCKKLLKETYFCNSFFKFDLFPSSLNEMKKNSQNFFFLTILFKKLHVGLSLNSKKLCVKVFASTLQLLYNQAETYKAQIIPCGWYNITSKVFLPYRNNL